MLVNEPKPGETLRWPDGAEVELLLYHAEGAAPASYRLVRIR